MANQLALDAFLGHSTRSNDGSQFLRGWRKRTPPIVNVFLHPSAPITALWQHGLPRVYENEDQQTRKVTRSVGGGTFNCLESEDILKKQYRRDDDGNRVAPPQLCPICKLVETVRALIDSGDLSFTAPLFKWEGDDASKAQVLTAGGIINAYGRKDLSEDEIAQMRAAGIRASEGWKESVLAKCNYLFVVIDADDADTGTQIAIETTSLGDHVKEVIKGQMVALGEQDGNPLLSPYALRWEHHPNEQEFNKKYKAIAMPRIQVTAAIRSLFDEDPPDTEFIVGPGNIATLRAELEARALVELPFDDIFGAAEEATGQTPPPPKQTKKTKGKKKTTKKPKPPPEPEPEADEEEADEEEAAPAKPAKKKTAKKKTAKKKTAKKPEPPPPPPKEQVECEECGGLMDEDATVCPHCGAEYELEDEEEDAPESEEVEDEEVEDEEVEDEEADEEEADEDEEDDGDEDEEDDGEEEDDIPF
jgi:hypothetical protein